ncbi:Type 1 glutamine amidotransferase-like domain-containing protein [Shewanella surugensis]|uniref:Type 1 glutamine amidotransferase-like domain-containing protein n=1 Tax=Shewanella surugensis TaxID=212020 RepID=A0ABT0LHI1_9GAMM|nr:Type 1 glutamine amidotransferase-like domain-containing protein [Shewanella surugensis]MCL1127162.1 Type 1 glutamine amidotransferase-like domain-containing protein [Shewanella surugensis]
MNVYKSAGFDVIEKNDKVIKMQMTLALISNIETKGGKEAITLALTDCHSQKPQVGYIASEPDTARIYFTQTKRIYDELSAELSTYVELEAGFDDVTFQHLLTLDAIHLSGGDTYRFLFALKQRNLMPALCDYVRNGGVLIGGSAGAMIMTPSIITASLCGDVDNVGIKVLSGLGVVPFIFVPHHIKNAEAIHDVRQLVNSEGVKCYLCSDDDSLVLLEGQDQWQLLGEPVLVI